MARLGGVGTSPAVAAASTQEIPATASPTITIPRPEIDIASTRSRVVSDGPKIDGKSAVSPSSAAILYGMTPPKFNSVDSGVASQSMDVDTDENEKGEKRTLQSMLTPPTDEKFKRQHFTDRVQLPTVLNFLVQFVFKTL